MRIFVVEQDGTGGLVHYAYQLCNALGKAGADVTLVTGRHYELADLPHAFTVEPRLKLWRAGGDPLPKKKAAALITRLYRKIRRAWRGVRYVIEWHRLTRYLIRQRPDIVQFSAIHFSFQALFLRRLRKAGLTLTQICHEFEPRERGKLTRSLSRKASGAVFDSFDLIYLHGDNVRSRFHEVFDTAVGRTRAIRHSNETMFLDVPVAKAGIDPPSRPIALFFGGLRPSKGLEDLLDAWAMAVDEITNGKLMIRGAPEGVDPAALSAQAVDLGVSASVDIEAGYQPLEQVASLMEQATIVVLPYRTATASGVLQLAYAFGVPVVATAVGALEEDVEPGATGLLVPPGDTHAIARAIVKLLSDPAEVDRMSAECLRAGKRFGWQPVAESLLADYRELIA